MVSDAPTFKKMVFHYLLRHTSAVILNLKNSPLAVPRHPHNTLLPYKCTIGIKELETHRVKGVLHKLPQTTLESL